MSKKSLNTTLTICFLSIFSSNCAIAMDKDAEKRQMAAQKIRNEKARDEKYRQDVQKDADRVKNDPFGELERLEERRKKQQGK